jgi:hypothetical protein
MIKSLRNSQICQNQRKINMYFNINHNLLQFLLILTKHKLKIIKIN